MANSVEVLSTGQVIVTEVAEQVIELTTAAQPLLVEVQTAGPQGPPLDEVLNLGDLANVNDTAKVTGSVLYYDAITSTWRGNDINTVVTLTDGGNF
jgi:hypothetical protein